jgi:hypothetical protein
MKKQIAFRIYDRISKTIEYPEILEQDNYGTYGENGIHSCEHPRFKRELGVTMIKPEHELPNCPIYLHELFDKKITVEVIGNIFINPDMDIK